MRAKEFTINEGREKITKDASSSIPLSHRWDSLDNSSPYHAYRFGIALAGMPDYPMDLEGPMGQKMMTISYTEADDQIIQATGKHLGFQGIIQTPKGSKEVSDTNTTSPVANWNKKTKGKKKDASK